jgi:hypothetical protein
MGRTVLVARLGARDLRGRNVTGRSGPFPVAFPVIRAPSPRGWWLLALVAGVIVATVALAAVPAPAGARRPVAEVLTQED